MIGKYVQNRLAAFEKDGVEYYVVRSMEAQPPMTSLHLILDKKNRVSMWPPPGAAPVKGVYHATINIGDLDFENPAEVTEAAIRLARLLLEHVPNDEFGE